MEIITLLITKGWLATWPCRPHLGRKLSVYEKLPHVYKKKQLQSLVVISILASATGVTCNLSRGRETAPQEVRTLQGRWRARGSLFNGWTALGWAAGEFRCIALPLLRSMIVHRSRHGDHCPCCTYMFLRFIDTAIPSFGHWGNSLS